MPFPVAFIYWWNYIWSSTHQRWVLVCETTNNFYVIWNPKFSFVQIQERCIFLFWIWFSISSWPHDSKYCVPLYGVVCMKRVCCTLSYKSPVLLTLFGPLINEFFLSKVREKWMRFYSGGVKQLSVECIWQTGPCSWGTVGWRNPTWCNSMQIFITAKLLYMFRASIALISGVHKPAVAASGTDRTIWGASFLRRSNKYRIFSNLIPTSFCPFRKRKNVSSRF